VEAERRRSGATGQPIVLADGQTWLIAHPVFVAEGASLTCPSIDDSLDRIFESAVLNEGISLSDLWKAAIELLRVNYDLNDDELSSLLSVSPGVEAEQLASGVLDAISGVGPAERTYSAWARASLIANGLGSTRIRMRDLSNVLAILVATNRTIPLSRFADACRLQTERMRLETLI
jgi:hypothetical protein